MEGVQGHDLEVEMWGPATVDRGVAEPGGGAVEVAVQGVAGRRVGDGEDGAGEGGVDGGAGWGEDVEAEVDGAGLGAVVAACLEGGGVVEEAGFAVAADGDGGVGGRDLSLDPGVGRTRIGGGVGVGEIRALDG